MTGVTGGTDVRGGTGGTDVRGGGATQIRTPHMNGIPLRAIDS